MMNERRKEALAGLRLDALGDLAEGGVLRKLHRVVRGLAQLHKRALARFEG